MSEEWRPVVGYEGLYEVSSIGRVKSLRRRDSLQRAVRERILKSALNNGYPSVALSKEGHGRSFGVHTLVAVAFLGPKPFEGAQVCHYDGNRANATVGNLRWDTQQANFLDSVRHGTARICDKSTHCIRGHEFTPENTRLGNYRKGVPQRICRTCCTIMGRARNGSKSREERHRPPQLWIPADAHGTMAGYDKYRCGCEACRQYWHEQMAIYKAERLARPIPERVHGTTNGYKSYDCRCQRCADAVLLESRARHARARAARENA